MEKVEAGKKYKFIKNFRVEAPPLLWYGDKGEVVTFKGPNGIYNHFVTNEGRVVLMSREEVFDYLEEARKEKVS